MPFILKAGKALNERKVEIRIQFRPPAAELNQSLDPLRNELVIRLQPDEAIYLKIVRLSSTYMLHLIGFVVFWVFPRRKLINP